MSLSVPRTAPKSPPGCGARTLRAVLILLLVYLTGMYVLQLQSPLHAATDGKRILSMAASGAAGRHLQGPLVFDVAVETAGGAAPGPGAGTRHYDFGVEKFRLVYPALLVGLERLGLARPWAFVALNLVFAALGLAGFAAVLRRTYAFGPWTTLAVCVLILLNFLVLKYCCEVMTDIPFWGVTGVLLWLLVQAEAAHGLRRAALLALGLLGALAATEIRSPGIAFLPVIVWVAVGPGRHPLGAWAWIQTNRRPLVGLALAGLVVLGLSLIFLVPAFYFQAFHETYGQITGGVCGVVTTVLGYRGEDLAAAVLNWPLAQIPARWQPGVSFLAFAGGGVAAYGFWLRRRLDAVFIFSVTYVCLLLFLPWTASRYWLPLLPFLLANLVVVAQHLGQKRWCQLVAAAYLLVYLVGAAGGQFWETRLSWGGPEAFARNFSKDPTVQAAYRAAYSLNPDPDLTGADLQTFFVLRRYDPRAQRYRLHPPAAAPAVTTRP